MSQVEVQFACDASGLPSAVQIVAWATEALRGREGKTELTVRIVDEAEGRRLNETYRAVSKPTNVLSFALAAPPGAGLPFVGDIAICAPVAVREAGEQGKTVAAHCAHLVVHGTLHLLGYDHEKEKDAVQMEAEEQSILSRLGFPDPYGDAR